MSQEQPQRRQDTSNMNQDDVVQDQQQQSQQQQQQQQQRTQDVDQEPIKYGDVFQVSGDLSDQPITPQDAAVLQTAETTVFGGVQQGGPAATVTAAATVNQRAGLVGQTDEEGGGGGGDKVVTVTATDYPGTRIITESVSGQVLGQYYQAMPAQGGGNLQSQVTIGQALEAAAQSAGDKPVDQSDAAAIQAAEVRASGTNAIIPGGVAAAAQSAASFNAALQGDEGKKIKLSDVLANASQKLPGDRAATRVDAEGVVAAELRNNPMLATHPGGVAASVAAAVRLNEGTVQGGGT